MVVKFLPEEPGPAPELQLESLTPTDRFQVVNGAQCRLWTGFVRGSPVHVYIAALSPQTCDPGVLADLEAALRARSGTSSAGPTRG